MKETIAKIIKDAIEDQNESWMVCEVDRDDDGDYAIRMNYTSDLVGGLSITVHVAGYLNGVYINILPHALNYDESSFWNNPKSYVYLNKANSNALFEAKFRIVDITNTEDRYFVLDSPLISYGEILTSSHIIPGMIRRLIWRAEQGIKTIRDAAMGI